LEKLNVFSKIHLDFLNDCVVRFSPCAPSEPTVRRDKGKVCSDIAIHLSQASTFSAQISN
ncbi:hypothetical protein, partial [uncultured Rothia sp.]|uniref:hypothetical protein n=1 Tax=uncultured Rothia sp. TaxID=316088 RepID=UPI0028D5AE5F